MIRTLQEVDDLGWFSGAAPRDLQDCDRFYQRIVSLVRAHALQTNNVAVVEVDGVCVLALEG